MTLPLPRIQMPTIGESTYNILRERILSRELAPGQPLHLGLMEKQLGISRTPLKEALKRLELEGLIEIRPRSGTYVTDPTPDDITESFEVRRILELYAVELAVRRAKDEDLARLETIVRELTTLAAAPDRDAIYPRYLSTDHEFHRQLVLLAQNRRLCEAHERENVHAQMARVRYRRSERELDTAQQEHERLVAALKARDLAAARGEIDRHLRRAERSILDDMGVNFSEEVKEVL